MISEERYLALDKLLKHPVIFSYDEETLKTKNKLLFISIVGIVSSFYGISISLDSSLLGIKFVNLNQALIFKLLTIFNIFFLGKFLWMTWEYVQNWRLRLTGSGENTVADLDFENSKYVDFTDHPKNSTLYNWWLFHAKALRKGNFERYIGFVESLGIEVDDKRTWDPNPKIIVSNLGKISSYLNQLNNVLGDGRVEYSLQRFDNAFRLFITSQNFRWFILDFFMPFILGVISIISLFFYKNIGFGLLLLWI